MSTEVLEEPEVYTMPAAPMGTPIAWYHGGSHTEEPHLGWVVRAYERSVDLVFFSARKGQVFKSAVRHLSDPRLRESADVARMDGAWDYTAATKAEMTRQKMVDSRLSILLGDRRPTLKPSSDTPDRPVLKPSLKRYPKRNDPEHAALRAQYVERFGKQPFGGWSKEKLVEKLST